LFSEANRDGTDAESPFPLFFSFSASVKNSRFGTGGLSLCLYHRSIIVAKYDIFPLANNCRLRKNSGESICSLYERALLGF